MKKWYVLKAIKVSLFVSIAIFVFGYGVMSLWNWLIPTLFNGPHIEWIQAVGLLVLSKLLFGGMGCGGRRGWGRHRGREFWRRRMEEKMASMTPEEKEKFRQQCGGWRWRDREEPVAGENS